MSSPFDCLPKCERHFMKALSPFPRLDRSLWLYPLAVAMVLSAIWLRLTFGQPLDGPVRVTFIIPIILAAYWGGLWPGLLATATSILATNYYLPPPVGSATGAAIQQYILALEGILISLICGRLRLAIGRANASRAAAESGRLAATQLAAIVESSTDAIIGKDLDGVITSWNAAACSIFGYEPAEVIGRQIALLIPPDRLGEENRILAELRAGRRIDHFETVRLRKDGAEILVSLSVSPIRDASGHIVGASKIARDVTEKRRAEVSLHVLQSELAHVARLSAMGQMSAAIAHELNQPLTAITNYVSAALRMLASRDAAPGKQETMVEAMQKAAAQALRAGSIIQHLREFVEKRGAERDREDINIVVEEAIALGLVGAAESSVMVMRELSRTRLPVRINRIQIQQVVMNIIRNGLEAMANSPQQEMTLTTAREDDFAVITISDTGPGLPPEIRAKLFQPFVTTKEKGMGIGLNICQSIVEAHGGNIEAPPVTAGAVFRIRLPLDLPGIRQAPERAAATN